MNKADIAQYLVNLNTLMAAQSSSGYAIPSSVMAAEYNKHWDMLKTAITDDDKPEPTEGRRI